MIWLLTRTRVFKFIAYTQSPVRTVRQIRLCSMYGVFVCVAYCRQSDTQRLPSSATDAYVWPACGHEAMFAEALV